MKFKKKYIVLATLILALGTAVYINWQFAGARPSTTSKELGAASYVSATAASTGDEATQTSSMSKQTLDKFAQERNKRQNTQDMIIDKAEEIFDLENTSDEDKSAAQIEIEEMLKLFTVQDSIESIIKAKGFTDCLCYISEEGVTVIVPDSELNETSALVIDDAVTSHYKVEFEKISIVGA